MESDAETHGRPRCIIHDGGLEDIVHTYVS